MSKTERPDFDHNLQTSCPAPIKAKITAYMKAVQEFAFLGAQDPKEHAQIARDLVIARYNLEQTIVSYLKRIE